MSRSVFLALLLFGVSLAGATRFTTVYEWEDSELGFDWTGAQRVSYKEEASPQYMAVHGDRIFLSLSKFLDAPASLAWLPKNISAASKLTPYPSWQFFNKSDCNGIHKAKGIEVDTKGRLWVLEEGSKDQCPAKLLIFDLATDKLELVHHFPDSVVLPAFRDRDLLEIVLDETEDDWLAYITESRRQHLVVFSLKKNQSWSVKTPGKQWLSLALTPKGGQRRLFLGQFNSKDLYSTSVASLRADPPTATPELVGNFSERPYRTLVDNKNVMYAAFLSRYFAATWNLTVPLQESRIFESGSLQSTYPFIFALDTNGTLWMTETSIVGWDHDLIIRLLKAEVGSKPYLYPAEPTSSSP